MTIDQLNNISYMISAGEMTPSEVFDAMSKYILPPSVTAQVIHYPECWDTTAFPTLTTAITSLEEPIFNCQTCQK